MINEITGSSSVIPVQETDMKTFYERVQAADLSKMDLTSLPVLDPNTDTKIGELDEFEKRIILVADELLPKIEEARKAYVRARQAHSQYHDKNPNTKHGGPLCEALDAANKVGEAIHDEYKEIMGILSSVIRLRFPEHLDAELGIRSDGSIALKQVDQSPENNFLSMLRGARVEIVRV